MSSNIITNGLGVAGGSTWRQGSTIYLDHGPYLHLTTVNNVREAFVYELRNRRFITLPNGVKTIELAPITFRADQSVILGKVNEDYVERELAWYMSQSRNVNDIPGEPPKIWKEVADKDGNINSNYGWCIFSVENGARGISQYHNVLEELKRDPSSRRGIMIYTRPSMHDDAFINGMKDFMCTNTVQYLIRNNSLVAHVSMRSNDAVFGYANDKAWQDFVHRQLANDLRIPVGPMYWTAGSLHFYERHFYLVDHFSRSSGELNITKEEYAKKYAEWA